MSSARAAAEAVLDELGISEPAHLKYLVEICIERGAYVRQAQLINADARLTVKGSHGIITVKPQPKYKTRTRFSIAHELGHFEMHRKQKMDLACHQKDIFDLDLGDYWTEKARSRESEANSFASELLMPERFIKPLIANTPANLDLIQELAQEYQTSFFATTKRFIQLTSLDCLAVFYSKEKVKYIWPSHSFSNTSLPIVRKLREGSLAYRASHGKRIPRALEAVSPHAWFNLGGAQDSYDEDTNLEWQECSRFFPKLGIGVSLLIL